MLVKKIVVKRIKDLCKAKGIAYNELAVKSGITPSTLYSLLDDNRKDAGIVTITKICDGLDMKLPEFFDIIDFWELEQEIK